MSNLNNHQDIIEFIQDYQRQVDFVVKVFKHKYNTTDILHSWRRGLYKQAGKIKEFGIQKYYFHGIGLAATIDNVLVDFDFSDYPDMRHDGFDAWRLHKFAENHPNNYRQFANKKVLDDHFSQLINDCIIYKPETRYDSTLYFFKDNKLIANAGHINFDTVRRKFWWKIF